MEIFVKNTLVVFRYCISFEMIFVNAINILKASFYGNKNKIEREDRRKKEKNK